MERRKDLVERNKDLVMVQWTFKLLVAEYLQTMWKRFVYDVQAGKESLEPSTKRWGDGTAQGLGGMEQGLSHGPMNF